MRTRADVNGATEEHGPAADQNRAQSGEQRRKRRERVRKQSGRGSAADFVAEEDGGVRNGEEGEIEANNVVFLYVFALSSE